MKKILIFLFFLILFGCTKTNSPKMEVEKLFTNYNSLSSSLLVQLDSAINNETLTDEQKEIYKDILKKQYEDLKYNILSEVIKDDTAIISVEIEVYNLRSVLNEIENENHSEFYIDGQLNKELFWNYKLKRLQEQKERIKYTLDLSLTKIKDKWYLDNLYESDRQKIHGLY